MTSQPPTEPDPLTAPRTARLATQALASLMLLTTGPATGAPTAGGAPATP